MDSLLIDDDYYLYRKYKQSQQLQQQQHQGYTSRNLINEYIAKTFNPPPIFKPSFPLSTSYYYDDSSCDKAQIELAYKHPQLLFDNIETNEESIEIEVNHDDDDDDSDEEFVDERQSNNINYCNVAVNDDDDDDDENEEDKSINSFNTITTTAGNYQTNKGIEIKYFKHSQDDLMNLPPPPYPSHNKFLRRTVSATNFHVKNHQQQYQQLQPQQPSPPPPINPNHYFDNLDEINPIPCKLIGKVNPAIAKTWEQLNAFKNNNNRYNLLSRSTSNMSDDSEKLFFCHPTVQESKSNFHVNKVIYCEEENSYDGKRTKQEEDDDDEDEDDGREQRKEDEDEEISGDFYDSIDDNNHYNYRHHHHQFVENNNNNVQRHQQQYHENIYSIEKHHQQQQQQQQQEDDAGEEMAEIDSIEKRNYFWSLENEFK